MEDKRTLNQMPGFKKGFDAPSHFSRDLGSLEDSREDHLAFALGVLARVYGSIDDPAKLWEFRNRVWNVEEKLGEMNEKRLKPPQNSVPTEQR